MASSEKAGVTESENISERHGLGPGHRSLTRKDEIGRIDAMVEAPEVTIETFAHLDEKKILRKVRVLDMLCQGGKGNKKN
jgi:hypothetical protein